MKYQILSYYLDGELNVQDSTLKTANGLDVLNILHMETSMIETGSGKKPRLDYHYRPDVNYNDIIYIVTEQPQVPTYHIIAQVIYIIMFLEIQANFVKFKDITE